MILSKKYNFIFIKTLKTAGTSLEVMLSPYMGPDDVLTPIGGEDEARREKGCGPRNMRGWFNPLPQFFSAPKGRRRRVFSRFFKRRKFYQHMAASEVKSIVPAQTWDNALKFCVERNPWDLQVSAYYFHQKTGYIAQDMSFEDYVRDGILQPNWELYAIGGKPAMDRVLKYETLDSELPPLLASLGLPEGLHLPKRKAGIRPTGDKYRDHYTPELKDLVATRFANEINAFGYEF